jgi:nitroimidazol reductase NimA-like FMN-containing flavoprotein (pyridoxamine 5'-phosphate oxidase superfamily)
VSNNFSRPTNTIATFFATNKKRASSQLIGENLAKLSESDVQFIQDLPVSHLATVTEACAPMVRPVWHVFDGKTIYFASDQTPKLKHITTHPNVSIVFDAYDPNNWENLRGIRFEGNAEILWTGQEYRHAHELLKSKYLEYRTVDGGWREGEIPIIKIVPAHVWKWAHGAWQKP